MRLAARLKPLKKPLRATNTCLDMCKTELIGRIEANLAAVEFLSVKLLLPKKGTNSDVWRYFGLRHEDRRPIEIDKPVCKLCFSNVSAKDGYTTNFYYAHLKNKHPEEYTATEMKASKPKKVLTLEILISQLFVILFCIDKSCQPMVMNTSGLQGVLRISWLRIGSQSIRLKNQVSYKWLKPFVLDISWPVAVILAV